MEYELYHHGVKGMRWGVRRSRTKRSYKVKQKKESSIEDLINRKSKIKKVVKISLGVLGPMAIVSAGFVATSRAGKEVTKALEFGQNTARDLTDWYF